MALPFEASRLKVWRAKQHAADIDSELKAYMDREPAYVNIRPALPPKDAGMVYHEVHVEEAIPVAFSVLLGDFVHNLRTSLDLLACDLVRLNNADVDGVYFPFAKDASQIETMIKRRNMDRAKPEVVDLIRAFKPYGGGNTALRGIHDLDIMDKHQQLVPSYGAIRIPYSENERIIPSSGVQFSSEVPRTGIITHGYIRAKTWPLGERQRVSFKIYFPSGPFASNELSQGCERLVQETSRVIDSFESLCFGAITKEFPWA